MYDKKIKACVYTEKIPPTCGVFLGIFQKRFITSGPVLSYYISSGISYRSHMVTLSVMQAYALGKGTLCP